MEKDIGIFSEAAGPEDAMEWNGETEQESQTDNGSITKELDDIVKNELSKQDETLQMDAKPRDCSIDINVNPPETYESDPSDIYDQSYLSDEDTSSLAGSFDEYGISEKDEDSYQSDQPVGTMKREEKLRRHAIRRHLDQLGELVIEREYIVEKTREQLLKCREHIEELEKCLEEVQEQTEEEDNKGNKAAYFRLKSQYEKLCTELQIEKDVERNTTKMLEDAEFALCQAYIEHGKFLPLDEELANDEKNAEKQKADKTAARLKKENAAVLNAERKRRTRERENLANTRERERKHRHALVAAKKNRELAMKYLKETMSRVRQRESEEEEKNRVELQQKMQALLSLKNNIEGNRENLHALQARDSASNHRDTMAEESERSALIAEGLHPDEVMTRRKRLRQFEREKEAFERKQREREIEIVDKILSEEKQVKRKQQQQPQLWPDRQRDRVKRLTRRKPKPKFAKSSGSESMEYSADVEDTGGQVYSYNRLGSRLSKVSSDDDDFSPYGATSRDEAKTGESEEEVIVAPEFKGLWETDQANENEEGSVNWRGEKGEYTAYEQKMILEALEKHRENIVQKQFAAGKEFQGAAFYSKPDVLEFRDFDVGKVYKKKVLLTNVSYAQNFCKWIDISDNLKDFIDIQFDPPGAMSAGLTCDFLAIFTPMLNQDIFGQVNFLAQTGPFSVKVKCLKKRCQLSVDSHEINFESQVVGETRRKTLTLKNDGALSTEFEFVNVADALSEADVEASKDELLDEENDTDNVNGEGIVSNRKTDAEMENVLSVGQLTKGVIPPFSSIKLDVNFSPSVPGTFSSQFKISFTDEESSDIIIDAFGKSVDVPVWVEREIVDMKICMFDRLYQDSIIVHNRATSALRLTFQIPKDFRDYVDILPKTAYIQAESEFSAQLKFLPRTSLTSDEFAPSLTSKFHKDSGLLEARILIRVADQTRPVPFKLKAVVTSSDFEFDTDQVNFGHCTVFESVRKTINLKNRSILSQAYGFISAPETIDVQPNDGFGTLLPDESLPIDIIFSPSKAKEYKFDLLCKSGIGREFKISCKAIGVLPPLTLSDSLIKFKATAINDVTSARIFIQNPHKSANEFTHPVPRIGSGPIFPVGPTSFQFCVPEDIPVSISPSVGTLMPGQGLMILVTFSPKLNELDVKKEALRMFEKKCEMEAIQTEQSAMQEAKENVKGKVKGRKFEQKSARRSKSPADRDASSTAKAKPPPVQLTLDDVKPGSDEFEAAHLSLLNSFANSFERCTIPCYLASGERSKSKTPLDFSNYYTLHLELHCPSVKPSVVVISDKGRTLIDFGNVAIGQKLSKVVSLQNISNQSITLTSTALNPIGSFEMLKALRELHPNSIHNMKIAFSPLESQTFYEMFNVGCESSMLTLRLKGVGVSPSVSISAENGILDVGDVLVGDTVTTVLKVRNTSNLCLDLETQLGSLLPTKHGRTQELKIEHNVPQENSPTSHHFVIGCFNVNGMIPFDCKPIQCAIKPGDAQDFTITFTADHPSENFADELCIKINGKEESFRVRLYARAWPSMTYVTGLDRLKPLQESHAASLPIEEIEVQDSKLVHEVGLLTFKCHLIDNEFSECTRTISVGCIKSNIQTKKSCDFSFENCKEANDLGFTFDPLKGGVDIGVKKTISFRWKPHNDHDPNIPVHTAVTLMVKGDVTLAYKVLLRGYIVSK